MCAKENHVWLVSSFQPPLPRCARTVARIVLFRYTLRMLIKPKTLQFKNLTCERDDRCLFADLSITLPPGSLLRIAGPNGAGKTTLLRILSALYEADFGTVHIGELDDYYESGQEILYLGHKPQVCQDLSVMDNLMFLTEASQAICFQALQFVGLNGCEDSLVRELSQGQGRRCALARLWCHVVPVWILDEPYTALDPNMVNILEDRITNHIADGGVCVFTTHQSPTNLRFDTLELGRVS